MILRASTALIIEVKSNQTLKAGNVNRKQIIADGERQMSKNTGSDIFECLNMIIPVYPISEASVQAVSGTKCYQWCGFSHLNGKQWHHERTSSAPLSMVAKQPGFVALA